MNLSRDFFPEYLINEYYRDESNFINNLKPVFIKTLLTSKNFGIGGEKIFKKIVEEREFQEILDLHFKNIKNGVLGRFLIDNDADIEELIRKSLKFKNIIMFLISCEKFVIRDVKKYLIKPYKSGERLFNSSTFFIFMKNYTLKKFKNLIIEEFICIMDQRYNILVFLKKCHMFFNKNSNIIPYFLTLAFGLGKGMIYFEYIFDITYFLIRYGFNINSKYMGLSAIEICYKNNFCDLVDYLIFKGASISECSVTASEILDMKSYHDFLKTFSNYENHVNFNFFKFADHKHEFEKGLFFNSPKISQFFTEIMFDLDLKDLDFFLNKSNKVRDYRFDLSEMLHNSVTSEREDLVDFFISKGVKIKKYLFKAAYYNKNNNILHKLLDSSEELDLIYGQYHKNVFELALSKIDKEKFLLFIQYGAKISLDEIGKNINPPFLFLLRGTLRYKSEEKFEDFKEITKYFPLSDIQKACDIFFNHPAKFSTENKREFRDKIIEFLRSLDINLNLVTIS